MMDPVMTPFELQLDDHSMMDEAGSHAEPAPRNSLMVHFEDELRTYHRAIGCQSGYLDALNSLLALGGIRRIYWMALAKGETSIAIYIANWWAAHHTEHNLGELIK